MRKHPVATVIILVSLAILTFYYFDFDLTPHSRKGKKIFEDYLARNHTNAKIISVNDVIATHYNPKGGRYKYDAFDYVSNYVEGYYLIGKDKYKFYVNIATGDIYTSEKLKEVQTKLANKFKALIDLDWKSVKIIFRPSITKHIGSDDKLFLSGVFSSEVKDIESIENDLFKNKYTSFNMYIYYIGKDINNSNLDNISNIKSVERSYLRIVHLSDSMERELLSSDDTSKLNRYSATEESASFSFDNGEFSFRKWADCNDFSPLVLHYLKYYKRKSAFKGKEEISEESYDIHKDLRIELGDNSYVFYKINDKLDFDIIFKDISLFGNEKQITIVNLMSKDDYIKSYVKKEIERLGLKGKNITVNDSAAKSSFNFYNTPKTYTLLPVSEGWVLVDNVKEINYSKALKYFKLLKGGNAKQILK